MDKQWRNLIGLIAVVVIVVLIFIFSNNQTVPVTQGDNEKIFVDYYSKGELVNFDYYENDFEELSSMHSALSVATESAQDNANVDELSYFLMVADLKVKEAEALKKLDELSENEELLCDNFEDLINLETDFWDLNITANSIYEVNQENNIVDSQYDLNTAYYSALYDSYKASYDFVFLACGTADIVEGSE